MKLSWFKKPEITTSDVTELSHDGRNVLKTVEVLTRGSDLSKMSRKHQSTLGALMRFRKLTEDTLHLANDNLIVTPNGSIMRTIIYYTETEGEAEAEGMNQKEQAEIEEGCFNIENPLHRMVL